MKVTIFNEYHPDDRKGKAQKAYPEGLHSALADIFKGQAGFEVTTATQEMPQNGLSDEVLDNTDVLVWWSCRWNNEVLESVCEKVFKRVLEGMGIIFLHSAHSSKPFKRLMGTTCELYSHDAGETEKLWTVDPTHPIAEGVPESFKLEGDETYGEFFDIPTPDEVVFLGWFSGGNVCRSGCTFRRGRGKIFYFQPGHETVPVYRDENVKKIIFNAVNWARPTLAHKPTASSTANNSEPQKRRFFKLWK